MSVIEIEIRQGLVTAVNAPVGTTVIIKDYDLAHEMGEEDGVDADGVTYVEQTHEGVGRLIPV